VDAAGKGKHARIPQARAGIPTGKGTMIVNRLERQAGTIDPMAETEATLPEQLEEIGVQLAWVRDYL